MPPDNIHPHLASRAIVAERIRTPESLRINKAAGVLREYAAHNSVNVP